MKPTEESIRLNFEVDLPKFEPVPLNADKAAVKEKVEIRAEDIASVLPDLDSLNLDALSNISSLIPSVHLAEQER